MTNTKLLNQHIEKSGKSKNHLAKRLGLSRQGLYNKINGISEFYASEISILIAELDLNIKERDDIFFNE